MSAPKKPSHSHEGERMYVVLTSEVEKTLRRELRHEYGGDLLTNLRALLAKMRRERQAHLNTVGKLRSSLAESRALLLSSNIEESKENDPMRTPSQAQLRVAGQGIRPQSAFVMGRQASPSAHRSPQPVTPPVPRTSMYAGVGWRQMSRENDRLTGEVRRLKTAMRAIVKTAKEQFQAQTEAEQAKVSQLYEQIYELRGQLGVAKNRLLTTEATNSAGQTAMVVSNTAVFGDTTGTAANSPSVGSGNDGKVLQTQAHSPQPPSPHPHLPRQSPPQSPPPSHTSPTLSGAHNSPFASRSPSAHALTAYENARVRDTLEAIEELDEQIHSPLPSSDSTATSTPHTIPHTDSRELILTAKTAPDAPAASEGHEMCVYRLLVAVVCVCVVLYAVFRFGFATIPCGLPPM